jgi:hypothetical protein
MLDMNETSKTCSRCMEDQPLTNYRRSWTGSLFHMCNDCRLASIQKGWLERVELLKDIMPDKRIESEPQWMEPDSAPDDVWVEVYCTWVDKFCIGIKRVNHRKKGWQIMFTKTQKYWLCRKTALTS